MSIRPSLRRFYGVEWRTIHRPAALARATVARGDAVEALLATGAKERAPGYGASARVVAGFSADTVARCACMGQCGRVHALGRCAEVDRAPAATFAGKVVLTVAHLDQRPWNMAPENLLALCQVCHNRLDAPYRARNRDVTWRETRAKADGRSPQARLFALVARPTPRRTWDDDAPYDALNSGDCTGSEGAGAVDSASGSRST